jgi:hypothetical protein
MGLQQIPSKGGIPSGNTAARPSSPAIGDTYYNGETGILEIYTSSDWQPCSASPLAPTGAAGTDVGTVDFTAGGSLSVAFTPGVGGGLVGQFTASTTAGGFTANGSSSPIVISGLTVGSSFVANVVAKNGFGNSIASNNTESITATTRPQVPTIGTATDTGNGGELSLTFTAGATGGKSITNYKYSVDGSTYTAFSPAQTTSPLTISGLTNGTSYTVRLKAVNANGDSPASSASNSATPTSSVTVNYLVIAGGGAGGRWIGAGGGAGGLRSTVTATGGGGTLETALSCPLSTNITVTVGAGGTSSSGGRGGSGNNSVFSTITSTGGGGGGAYSGTIGGNGGSSGGGGYDAVAGTRTASPVQGFNGGSGVGASNFASGGGGGSGGQGANARNGGTGNGGIGTAVSITGSSVTYAGGGGSGTNGPSVGIGEAGGGNGGNNGSGTSASANSGSGGGGEGSDAGNNGSGGSGVVILRYPSTRTITVGAGLTADATGTDGSFSYKRFTAGSGNVSFA